MSKQVVELSKSIDSEKFWDLVTDCSSTRDTRASALALMAHIRKYCEKEVRLALAAHELPAAQ